MGCFLGCFGDAKDQKNKKRKTRRASPKGQKRNQVENARQHSTLVDQSILETPSTNLVSELQNKPKEEEKLSPSPKKRVTFNSNITTHDHVSVFESTDSLPECDISVQREKEKEKDLKASNPGSKDGNSITSSVGSYPSNHRYHDTIDSDDEAEDYGDSEDLDDDLDDFEDEEGFNDCDEDDADCAMNCQGVWSESIVISSAESRVENHSANSIDEEVESHMLETWQPCEAEAFGPRTNARDRRDYVNSVLNPVENITQWKAIKSKGTSCLLKPQKENLISYSEHTCKHISPGIGIKSDELKKSNQEVAVDASLSNWLVSPEITPSKNNFSSQLESVASGNTFSKGSHSVRSFEDRPILGALTVDELKQISVSSSPKKTSPIRNPDEMPIIGTVGTYWNHSGSTKNFSSTLSNKGIPNTTSKYREDKIVHWQSTPFETRLERALNQGSTGA